MGSIKSKTPERSSARLSAMKRKQETRSDAEAELQGCLIVQKQPGGESLANENPLEEQQKNNRESQKKDKMRVQLPEHVKHQLDELTSALNFKFIGDTVDWISPSETKALLALTKQLGYAKGGETIDYLLAMRRKGMLGITQASDLQRGRATNELLVPTGTERFTEVAGRLGFNGAQQTVECLLAMARSKPLRELTNLLGFQDYRKTVEWVLNETQQNVAAMKNSGVPTTAPPQAESYSTNLPSQFPANQLERSAFQHPEGGGRISPHSMYNNRPPSQTSNLAGLTPTQRLQQHQPSGLFGSHNLVPHHEMMPPNNIATGNHYNVSEIEMEDKHSQFGMVNSQSSTCSWLQESQQESQFQTNGQFLEENEFPNWMTGQEASMQLNQFPNLTNYNPVQGSNNNHINFDADVNGQIETAYPAQDFNEEQSTLYNEVKRTGMEDGYKNDCPNSLQIQFPAEVGGNLAINQVSSIGVSVRPEDLNQNSFNSVDLGLHAQEEIPSSVTSGVAVMPIGIQLQKNSIAKNLFPHSNNQYIATKNELENHAQN